jgi:putative hemolysin
MINVELGFFICLLLSAFFSSAEMAFVSINKIKLREKADAGNRFAQKAIELQNQPQNFMTAILVGNNVVNITAIALATYWLDKVFAIRNEWIVTAITAPILIIFGETVPKDYGRLRSYNFLLTFAGVLTLFVRLLSLLTRFILKGIDAIMRAMGMSEDKSIFVSEKEFRSLIEESVASGVLGHHEKQLIDTILDFEQIHVDSVMIPVDKVPKVDITVGIKKLKEVAKSTHSRMILIYEEIPSIIVGMVYVFDLLFEKDEEQGLKKYLRSPIFLPSHTSIERAFLTLQEKRQSFAVVTDMHGEVIGVVPIERLFSL